jgi:hypothetical protein
MSVEQDWISAPLILIAKLTRQLNLRLRVVRRGIALIQVVLPVVLNVKPPGVLVVRRTAFLTVVIKMVIVTVGVMGTSVKTTVTAALL